MNTEMMESMEQGRNKVIDQINSDKFERYNICDVMDWIYLTFNKEPLSQTWEWECKKVMEFCENFNLHLYEKPREDFFPHEGAIEAMVKNKKGVILSDLS
jgi:ASC-1-like (ASCH) protein